MMMVTDRRLAIAPESAAPTSSSQSSTVPSCEDERVKIMGATRRQKCHASRSRQRLTAVTDGRNGHMEDEACNRQLQHFPKFRALAKEVEACLQVFEHAKDWSDYVSGLTRLIKVLQRAEFCDAAKVGDLSVIPDKATIARRLAQSVNPILPNGVHRKALDAYRVILSLSLIHI